MLGLSASLSKASVTLLSFLKDNLKLFFDFKNTDLEHVGTGSANFATNQSLTIPDIIAGENTFTCMAWVKKAATGDSDGLVIMGDDASGSYFRQTSTTRYLFHLSLDGDDKNVQSAAVTDSTEWMHVAATYGDDAVKIYIDGALSNTTLNAGNNVVSSDKGFNRIGEYGSTFCNGKLKNVAIWHRVLSESEIQNVMYKTYNDLKGSELTHLQSWYALESSTLSGSDATGNNDITANNNTVTFTDSIYGGNTPTKPRGVDNSEAALADQIGSGSASFDGTDDYIDCGLIDFNTDDVSIVAWYKADTLGAYEGIVSNRDSSGDKPGIQIRIDDGGDDIELFTDCGSTTFSTKTDSFVPSTGVWTHIAATIDRSALQSLYIDGALQATTDISGQSSADLTNADNLRIGRSEASAYFDGNIAQVGIWVGRVLTQEEIQEISQKQYSKLTTSEKTNLISWWGLDSLHGQNAVEDKNGTESLGSEIVVNGEFTGTFDTAQDYSSDFDLVTGWRVHTAGSGGSPHTATEGDNNGSQAVRIQSSSSPGNYINVRSKTAFTLTAGTLYKLTFDAKKENTATFLRIKTASGQNIAYPAVAGTIDATLILTDTMTTYTYYFRPTATDTSSYIAFGRKGGDGSANFTIDNISLKTVTGSNVGVLL